MMVQGIHFLPEQDPADVAWKLVATNLSDLAAKGAKPLGVLLGYTLDGGSERFLDGLQQALNHFDVPLLGGDTVGSAGPQTLGLTAIGAATHCPVPSRAGCAPGDGLYVTGPVGAAMMGFEALKSGSGDSLAYRRPNPRLNEGMKLAPIVSAIMDISDGLLLDALRMADASNVTLSIESEHVPIAAPEARRDDALRWGDDYELLFTAPCQAELPVPATRIGTAMPREAAALLLDKAAVEAAASLGYRH